MLFNLISKNRREDYINLFHHRKFQITMYMLFTKLILDIAHGQSYGAPRENQIQLLQQANHDTTILT